MRDKDLEEESTREDQEILGIGAMAMFVVSACSTAASPASSSPAASTAAQSQAPASAPAEAKTLTVWLMNGSASDDLVKQSTRSSKPLTPASP